MTGVADEESVVSIKVAGPETIADVIYITITVMEGETLNMKDLSVHMCSELGKYRS